MGISTLDVVRTSRLATISTCSSRRGKDGQYVPVSANETMPYITKAQYANSNQRNISY